MLAVSGDDGAPEEHGRATIITVFSAKGGCGKTTVSTNLAAALAEGGRREVCVVDLDLAFGDVAIAMQLFPTHSISDAVALEDTLDQSGVESLLTQHSSGLRVLSAPVEPGLAENIPVTLVNRLLSIMKDMFDYVIIDTPPAFTDQVLAAFDASDLAILLATLDIPALKNLKLSLETLELLNYPKEKLRLILNRADSKVGLDAGEVEKTLRAPISALIPSSRAVPAATNRGVPIVLDQPHHPVSLSITQFVEQHVVSLSSASAIPSPLRSDRRGGLLRRKAKQP
jgi:pilus assembly protein CpaE